MPPGRLCVNSRRIMFTPAEVSQILVIGRARLAGDNQAMLLFLNQARVQYAMDFSGMRWYCAADNQP